MTRWQWRLFARLVIFLFFVCAIYLLARYGPQPLTLLDLFDGEIGELGRFYSHEARLERFLISLGPYSSAAFILLQAFQVVFSPIPGELTGVVGGYIYGETFGLVLSTVGLALGSWLAFELARLLGRPFVEKWLSNSVLEKFHFLTTRVGAAVCFVLFVLPGFPKDALCYLLGLSHMRLGVFLLVSTIGRIPGTYLLTVQGASIKSRDFSTTIVVISVCAALLLAAYFYRARLFHWAKNQSGEKSVGE